ncbi:peptidylprolyl isomerase [Gelidibacter algens]|jgi:peptidylprolyl isomerase|uniref:peptidylprolyl isomerase n=1 Tax=Gelidibacter algens TaxID=49280 RepID=A0A1A7R0X6_9FLAO|nr:peptidylprolyl isomerase [Gelidibacter algens]OBX25905.1 peptidylprolyl isomerase [Gelidibacter algens]RAJ25298.1 peptidylprolyl isomerase [Gelidibacter algens]
MRLIQKAFGLILLMLLVTATACNDKYPDLEDGLYTEIITNQGTMVLQLEYQKAPVTVANFISLAEGTNTLVDSAYIGKKYYNGLTFHRIIDEFMIQGGDPTGTGSGSPGYKFNNEISDDLKHDKVGTLSMANSGPNTNGSQFFITEGATPNLDGGYNVFGYLVMGEDVLHTLSGVETTKPGDKPVNPVIMEEVNIIRKGKDAKNFDAPNVFKDHFAKAEQEEKERLAKEEELQKARTEKSAAAAADMKPALETYEGKSKTLASGLKMYNITKGTGDKPKTGATAILNYEGYYTDGRLFDSNVKSVEELYGMYNEQKDQAQMYNPMPTKIGPDAPMIAGFREAASQMRVGDKSFFYLPSHLAYGERGNRVIPPNTDLIFIIEMVGIE